MNAEDADAGGPAPVVDAATFLACDLRVGTVRACVPIPAARVPAYRLTVDLGPLGTVTSSARVTDLYTPEDVIGTQVVCVTNLPPRQVGAVRSQVLVLGVYRAGTSEVVLLRPDRAVGDGDRVG